MSKPKQLSEKEFYDLVHLIAKPTFNFMMRRVNNEVLKGDKFKSLDVNDFFNVLVSSMASVDANFLRWMQNFYKIKSNSELDFQKLTMTFIKQLNESLSVVVQ